MTQEQATPGDDEPASVAAFWGHKDRAHLLTELETLRAALAASEAREKKLIDVLTRAEWGATTLTQSFCPLCGNEKAQGHLPYCKIRAVLAVLNPKQEER